MATIVKVVATSRYAFPVPAGTLVSRLANQSVGSGPGGATALSYDAKFLDEMDAFDPSFPTKLTIRVAGTYVIESTSYWAAFVPANTCIISIRINGVIAVTRGAIFTNTGGTAQNEACLRFLSPGDTVDVVVQQSTGSNLDVTGALRVVRIGLPLLTEYGRQYIQTWSPALAIRKVEPRLVEEAAAKEAEYVARSAVRRRLPNAAFSATVSPWQPTKRPSEAIPLFVRTRYPTEDSSVVRPLPSGVPLRQQPVVVPVLVQKDPRATGRTREHIDLVTTILNSLIYQGILIRAPSDIDRDNWRIGYIPGDQQDWGPGAPTEIWDALDALAAKVDVSGVTPLAASASLTDTINKVNEILAALGS